MSECVIVNTLNVNEALVIVVCFNAPLKGIA